MIDIYYGMELIATLPGKVKPKLGTLLTVQGDQWRVIEIRDSEVYCDIPMCIETVGYRNQNGTIF